MCENLGYKFPINEGGTVFVRCQQLTFLSLERVFYIWLCLSKLLNLNSEVTKIVENVTVTLISIMCVNNEHILFEVYFRCECISS